MNKENTEALIKRFPNLYQGCGLSPKESNMCFGFECGDGWFDLIEELSTKLEPMGVIATQVKEKYGGLRFYVASATDEAWDLIDEAEEKSEAICETCGDPGRLRTNQGWDKTLCDACGAVV